MQQVISIWGLCVLDEVTYSSSSGQIQSRECLAGLGTATVRAV